MTHLALVTIKGVVLCLHFLFSSCAQHNYFVPSHCMYVLIAHAFLFLCNVPCNGYIIDYLSIHLVMSIWIISSLGLLGKIKYKI